MTKNAISNLPEVENATIQKDDSRNMGTMKFENINEGILDEGVKVEGVLFKDGIIGISSVASRFRLDWVAGRYGKPGLNADVACPTPNAAEIATMLLTDKEMEILGTNGTSALCTINAEGGITLTTAGADNDQMILVPHLDTGLSRWTGWTWGTDQETEWEATIKSGSAITAETIWAGLKLTNTSVIATDNNQAFFRYAAADSAYWQIIYSIGGTDTTVTTEVAVAASTVYNFKIKIDSARIATFYINDVLVATSTALAACDLIPYIGIQANAGSAKHMHVRNQSIGRLYA